MHEYGVVWNTNVLFGENKHRFFKKAVVTTNHKKPEHQLLLKDAINFTVKAALNGAFLHTDMNITSQLYKLQQHCPTLLKSHSSSADIDANEGDELDIASTPYHAWPAVCG